MKYEISVSKNGQYVTCEVIGEINLEYSIEIAKNMFRKALEIDTRKMLINLLGSKNVSNVTQNYDFAYKYLAENDINKNIKLAMLASTDDNSHEFIETVMLNAGYTVKIFHDEKDAISWLTGSLEN